MSYTVYAHISPCGKKYIGITGVEPEKRWQHGLGYRRNTYMSNAIKKYGWDSFKHLILLKHIDKTAAENAERFFIEILKTNERDYGYNITGGGECIGKHSEKSKRLMSEKLIGRPPSRLGAKASEETRAKMSKAAKIRNAKRDKCIMAEKNKKKVICVETGDIYECISYAAKEHHVTFAAISNACRGVRPTAAGYHWGYWRDENAG